MPEQAIYRAEVTHARSGAVRHRLRHEVFYLYVDLDRLPDMDRRLRVFSHNRFNLLGLYDRDHGPRDGRALKPWVEEHLKRAGLYDPGGRICLLSLPRILGYAFNPLSVYYCYDSAGALIAVLHEVRNTFGEMHAYLLPAHPDAGGVVHQETAKQFHVSPFIAMAARYRFRLTVPGARLTLGIRETMDDGSTLTAILAGHRVPLTDRALLRAVGAMPWMTVKVIAAIHWHGARLWLKGARYHRKPPPPEETVTVDAAHAPARVGGPRHSDVIRRGSGGVENNNALITSQEASSPP